MEGSLRMGPTRSAYIGPVFGVVQELLDVSSPCVLSVLHEQS